MSSAQAQLGMTCWQRCKVRMPCCEGCTLSSSNDGPATSNNAPHVLLVGFHMTWGTGNHVSKLLCAMPLPRLSSESVTVNLPLPPFASLHNCTTACLIWPCCMYGLTMHVSVRIAAMDLKGRKVAVFGCGDQVGSQFCDEQMKFVQQLRLKGVDRAAIQA